MVKRRALLKEWHGKTLRLYFVGDVHEGSAACDESAADKLASVIEIDPFGLAVGMGDLIEAISYTDKRFDPQELSQPITPELLGNPFYEQSLRFCKRFERTRGKWLCLISGNHEETAARYSNYNPVPTIAERLGTYYLGGSDCGGWVKIHFIDGPGKWRSSLSLYLTHGNGSGELRGADALRLQRLMMRKAADIVAIGHGHKPGAFPESREGLDNNLCEQSSISWGIECFPMIGKHGYIARKGGNAPPIGYVVAEIEFQWEGRPKISVRLCEL
jgi:hypothetical protein